MCYFVSATLPQSVDELAVADMALSYGLGLKTWPNPSLEAQLPGGDRLFHLTTRGMCDCSTVVRWRRQDDLQQRQEHLQAGVEERRRQGWSEAKIARWSADKSRAIERKVRRLADEDEREINSYLAFIPTLLKAKQTPRLGLLIHFYRGPIAEELIAIRSRQTVPIKRLSASFLAQIEDDVLYEFVR